MKVILNPVRTNYFKSPPKSPKIGELEEFDRNFCQADLVYSGLHNKLVQNQINCRVGIAHPTLNNSSCFLS